MLSINYPDQSKDISGLYFSVQEEYMLGAYIIQDSILSSRIEVIYNNDFEIIDKEVIHLEFTSDDDILFRIGEVAYLEDTIRIRYLKTCQIDPPVIPFKKSVYFEKFLKCSKHGFR